MMMSSKHNLFDRHGPLGRGSVLDLDICSPFWFYVTFLFIFFVVKFLANLMDFGILVCCFCRTAVKRGRFGRWKWGVMDNVGLEE